MRTEATLHAVKKHQVQLGIDYDSFGLERKSQKVTP